MVLDPGSDPGLPRNSRGVLTSNYSSPIQYWIGSAGTSPHMDFPSAEPSDSAATMQHPIGRCDVSCDRHPIGRCDVSCDRHPIGRCDVSCDRMEMGQSILSVLF